MRTLNALRADMRFQFKQGFYLVYVAIVVMYLIILHYLPTNILGIALPLVVYSDPSVLGMFFIGGIIMLEKGQGLLQVFTVTPLRTAEYLIAKVLSLAIVSVLATIALTVFSAHNEVNWLLVIFATVLTSGIFTLCGVLISAGCRNVNQYLLKTIPYMLLFVLPCFSLIWFPSGSWFCAVPSVAALRLMLGAFTNDISILESGLLLVYLIVMNYIFFRWAERVFESKIVFNE
ncbi:MAG: transporter [Bacteroidetes bacterium]|nr:transporter [Bacteroidota bacterium]